MRKGDSDVAIIELKARVDIVAQGLDKIDMVQIIPRNEYSLQHTQLIEKLEEAQANIVEKTEVARTTISEKTEAIKENFELRLAGITTRLSDTEKLAAGVYGKLWAMGIVGAVILMVMEVVFRYLVNK